MRHQRSAFGPRIRRAFRQRVCALLVIVAAAHAQQLPALVDDCTLAPNFVLQPNPNGYSVGASTSTATVDGSCSCTSGTSGPDVWLRFTPTTDGELRAYTYFYSSADWTLSLHDGCPGTVANEIACDDDSPFLPNGGARLDLDVEAGRTYWLRLSSSHGGAGTYILAIEFPVNAWPLHDDPSRAVAISPSFFHDTGFDADYYDPMLCIGARGVWYRYTPAQNGIVLLDTCTFSPLPNATDDTTIGVYNGTTQVGCVDDSCNYLVSFSFAAVAGQTYLIRVSDWWGAGGDFNLGLQGPPASENVCASLPPLLDGLQLVSLLGAGADGASACDAGTEPDMSYEYAAPTDGTLNVTTCGTSDGPGVDQGEDTLLSIHSACPPTAANTIACNDNASPPCPSDVGAIEDASVDTVLAAGQRVVVRITRAGPQTTDKPIVVTATFRPGISFCAGDGSGTACPCANFGAPDHGCAHSSFAGGALLRASGVPSVSSDTLLLEASDAPANAFGLYIQGSALVANGNGAPFGDGLRCVTGNVIRLGVRASSHGASSFGHGDGTGASVAQQGLVPASGGLRHYQFWFRDAAPFCTSSLFNLSNALSVQWVP
jgi:hypothetical protein